AIIHAEPTRCPLPEFDLRISDGCESVAAAWNTRALSAAPPVQMEAVAWKPIDAAPRGRKVIVSVPNGKNHAPITMMGRFWPHGTLEVAEGYEGEDWAVEVNGVFYMPEGWYEECEVEDAPAHNIEPTHWMPLPSAPGASP